MQFFIYYARSEPELPITRYPVVTLYQDNWDDFGHRCRFVAALWTTEQNRVELGPVHISINDDDYRTQVPAILDDLPEGRRSLGESIAYYRTIRDKLAQPVAKLFLEKMGDVVADPELQGLLVDTHIWEKAFLRESSSKHALARGGFYVGSFREEIVPPEFSYSMHLAGAVNPHHIDISFARHSGLPHRTMLFVGRNGTGKTRALSALAFGLQSPGAFDPVSIGSIPEVHIEGEARFSRVIAVSYNAFDEFPLPLDDGNSEPELSYRSSRSYQYCGLRNTTGTISLDEISMMLKSAIGPVKYNDRTPILTRVVSTLLGEKLSSELFDEDGDLQEEMLHILSAGQRLVLAIFSNIVGFIEEGSLLLIDEPETNLHPGLLSTVIGALEEVLEEFDSYGIVATHSPILLQQIPSRYVRLFERLDDNAIVRTIKFESFGEDLGELTRSALGLADPERDFTTILRSLHDSHRDADEVEELFEYPLGLPAKTFLYSLEEAKSRRQRRR